MELCASTVTGMESDMSTLKTTNLQHPSAASPAIVLDAAGNATVAGMGLVLVKPTGIANSGGSASLSGGAVTFTGVTSVSLNGVFSAAFDNYRIIFTATASTTANATMRLRLAGTDASAGAYGQAGYYAYMDAVGSGFVANGGVTSTSWLQTTAMSTLSQSGFIMDIQNPARAVSTFGVHHTSAVDANYLYAPRGVRHTTATAYDGFSSIASAGTMTGAIRVYGYQNS